MVEKRDRYTVRAGRSEDNPEIVSVLNAASVQVLGGPSALIDDQGRLRQLGDVRSSAESAVTTDANGNIVGYQFFYTSAPYVIFETGGAVQPALVDDGVREGLLRWAEAQAASRFADAPAHARLLLYWNVYEADTRARDFLLANGFNFARQWIHLAVELIQPPQVARLPDGIVIKLLDPKIDWPKVDAALDEAFADHWGELVAEADVGAEVDARDDGDDGEPEEPVDDPYFNSQGLCFVAWEGDEVIGCCLCNDRIVERADSGRLGSLSVRRAWRGRGIGRALILTAFAEFYRRGTRRVVTDTDADSFSSSYRLYESVGMSVYRRQNLYEKELRSGVELRLLAPDS